MSEQKHTPEPWAHPVYEDGPGDEGWWIYNGMCGADQYAIAVTFSANPNKEADARRMAACVNALAGLSDLALSGGWNYKDQNAYAVKVEQQRTLLLKALEAINDRIFAKGAPLGSEDYFFIRQTCCDAVKAVEGGAE